MSRPDGYLMPGRATVDAIVAEVARGFDVDVHEMRSSGRRRHVAFARSCAMAVIREATDWSYPTIGDYFSTTHDTVIKAVRRVMADPELRQSVRDVVEELSPPPRLFGVQDEAG